MTQNYVFEWSDGNWDCNQASGSAISALDSDRSYDLSNGLNIYTTNSSGQSVHQTNTSPIYDQSCASAGYTNYDQTFSDGVSEWY